MARPGRLLNPVGRDEADIALAKQGLPQHVNAVVDSVAEVRLGVVEGLGALTRLRVVVVVGVLADEVLEKGGGDVGCQWGLL